MNYLTERPVTQKAFDLDPDDYDPGRRTDTELAADVTMFEHFLGLDNLTGGRLAPSAAVKLVKALAEQEQR